jgi:thiol-disulfide isomerase/thioredoxin
MRLNMLEATLGTMATAVFVFAIGCGGKTSDSYTGNMDDLSYAGRRQKSYGTSASGNNVTLAQYAGRFVWVDYSAPWCGPCRRQAPIIKRLEHSLGNKVVFLTVLTSDDRPGSPTNRYTARRWANQYRLDPDRVVAGSEWQRVIPHHILFSPLGQTLYEQVGLQSEAQIQSNLRRFMADWDRWYAENKNSMSVLLGEIAN